MSDGAGTAGASRTKVRWFSRRSAILHLALIVWFPGCLVAMWWQVTVALAGNALGWLYAIEWPVFAMFGVIGWWQLVHDDAETVRARRWLASGRPATASADAGTADDGDDAGTLIEESSPAFDHDALRRIHVAEQDDADLAAYNAYLARLASVGHAKTWRNPTGVDQR